MRVRSGAIRLAGTDLVGMRAHRVVALGLGHVPEGRRIFSALTVEENLRIGAYLLRRDPAEIGRRMDAGGAACPREPIPMSMHGPPRRRYQ